MPKVRGRLKHLTPCHAIVIVLVLGAGAAGAAPTQRRDTTTVKVLWNGVKRLPWEVILPNFERAYPNIKIEITWAATTTETTQLLLTQLAAGNGPDLFAVAPGSGGLTSVTRLAKAGYLEPYVGVPWVKRLVPFVTSLDKVGKALYAFTPGVWLYALFHNDDLFQQLGLGVPQTFDQLLDVCRKAKAAGKIPYLLAGGTPADITALITGMASSTVFANDPKWISKRKQNAVTFAGTPGWRQALQQVIDMNTAGCFQPGAAGMTTPNHYAMFASGQGLMLGGISSQFPAIDVFGTNVNYSVSRYPATTRARDLRVTVGAGDSFAINSKSHVKEAALTFVNFLARPKQNALWASVNGWITQDDLLKGRVPSRLSNLAPMLENGTTVLNPGAYYWNADVGQALATNAIGLITGQRSVDDVLQAMDAAWNQGPES
jgi:raffinose/stachyose/melibiose transport system substrate-binding protein